MPLIGMLNHTTSSRTKGFWVRLLGVKYNQTIFGGAMHRRYYKPNPGYTGQDAFSVLVEFYKIDKPYKVEVR
jgi:hypothetical protein